MAPDTESSFRHLLDAARGAASAYRAAASGDQIEQHAAWLRQQADEHEQNVRLLVPQVESVLQHKAASWLAPFVEGSKATVGRWLGVSEMYGVLQSTEQKLLEALSAVLALPNMPVELRSLCEDQQASATMRQGHLTQRLAVALEKAVRSQDRVVGHGKQGHPGDTVNKTKAVASENSDC